MLKAVFFPSRFTALCERIGASMIRDHNQLSLDVSVDESSTGADVSVSLGLIVTELVIISSWNRGAERLFGYTAAEAIGKHVAMPIPYDRIDEEPDKLARIAARTAVLSISR